MDEEEEEEEEEGRACLSNVMWRGPPGPRVGSERLAVESNTELPLRHHPNRPLSRLHLSDTTETSASLTAGGLRCSTLIFHNEVSIKKWRGGRNQ
ncbi:hypothetical protein EYF80_015010 [Liparis tanakae]|uniref:Uncharacterized protein n=1 Tax=Liparis tanakae TaxID=230148 RepID=A0A4Z2IBA5_9TELE|nr:hypothetical protein EYF80_015010 [Liparis tanakae]